MKKMTPITPDLAKKLSRKAKKIANRMTKEEQALMQDDDMAVTLTTLKRLISEGHDGFSFGLYDQDTGFEVEVHVTMATEIIKKGKK